MTTREELKDQATSTQLLSRLHDDLQAEYSKIVDIVAAFDQRLLTIEGWELRLASQA